MSDFMLRALHFFTNMKNTLALTMIIDLVPSQEVMHTLDRELEPSG